ncbi:hypothetical protein [Aliterella atlantica]|uniref:Uncharacterized protein n=1 Tax=Aliterella atlantica CENA595 TaxID=1618023 RepID=A0A0D8ZUF2_9CYAN|nr:hypothetical protein [Aliterella atlantica]KJH72350.1 hypothetical protein UH38_08020 [Aliterella atlantica CENA595]
MSSATSNRYQSRLFNFVYKRSRRLSEQLNRAVQSVTSWIMPVVSYPAQVLHARVNKSLPQLPELDKSDLPPNADTPVKNVLSLVQGQVDEELVHTSQPPTPTNFLAWLGGKISPKTQTTSIPSSTQPVVRGIASYISSRALVLVTPQNEILDILDSWQQQKLQARITNEIAQYWRYQRLLVGVEVTTERLPGKKSLPVRLFSNVAAWLQVGGLSKSSDRTFPDSYDERGELIFATQQAIAFLDRSIAQFEANHLSSPAKDAAKTNKWQIQALIWVAIDYFFGDRQGKKLQHQIENNLNLPTNKQVNLLSTSEDKIADPWLTLEDLFGVSKLVKQPAIVADSLSFKIAQLPEDSTLKRSDQLLNKYSLRSLFKRIQPNKSSLQIAQKFQYPTQLAKVERKKERVRAASKLPRDSQQLNSQREVNTVFNLSNTVASQSSNINHTPDWIETEATTMGYIKHPLEQLLAWLDSAMLWLEELLVKIWQQLEKVLIGK